MAEEIWVPVIRFEGLYEVSNLGRVRSLTRPNKLEGLVSQRIKTGNYLNIHLCRKGKGKEYRVHRIVLESFKGLSLEGNTQVNHKDGDKHNNCLDNLEWSNSVDNALHRSRVLFKNIGEQHGLSKLTEEDGAGGWCVHDLDAGGLGFGAFGLLGLGLGVVFGHLCGKSVWVLAVEEPFPVGGLL